MSNVDAIVATFVAGQGAALDEATVRRALKEAGVGGAALDWLAPGLAADAVFDSVDLAGLRTHLPSALSGEPVDVVVQALATRRKLLLVADMDSTMIEQECLDELADFAGMRARISKITARAMAGELDFEAALRERVALLAGVTLDEIETLLTRLTLTAGARALVSTMRAHGAHTALVSGGFTQFTQPVAERLGFHEARANRLDIVDRALTGDVLAPVQGREGKRAALVELRARLGLPRAATLAVGDGANDLDMLREAGLGVAYHAKPKVAEAAHARVDSADLTALLYAQGYRKADIVEQ
ncbi:phosphoserine phosphatase SerB [Methylocystis echinoides]|uniref:phosphoserine phosphatase SerB n=1 Tax=Methylocystis echinoides TaxID=29468 RepID=UPI003438FEEF